MNHSSTIRRCILILLTFLIIHPVRLHFIPYGYLTVEPGNRFRMGSNLTVWCHFTKHPERLKWFDMALELNGEAVLSRSRVNRTTMKFSLPNVETPNSTVICKENSLALIVNGLDLYAGLPPEKPRDITCETTKSSEIIDCSWRKGWETYFPTYYNISVHRENGTKIYLDRIKVAEKTTLPRRMLDTNTKYLLIITAYNYFGVSESDPFTLCVRDIVIPETPHITWVAFRNTSTVATLRWKTSESSVNLRLYVRLRTDNITWAAKEGQVLSEGLIQVDNLKPLTEYEFQMRTCQSAEELTHTNFNASKCSKWSSSMRKTSPGKAPSQQLDVWRTLRSLRTHGMQMVTVLWKPPPPEDCSGEVQQYKIFWATDQKHEVTCSAAVVQWTGQVSARVQTLTVTAVTLYGTSLPAHVTLTHSDVLGPVLGELTPALSGRGLLVSWSWLVDNRWSTLEAELLYYVIEWTSVPAGELQWQKLSKDLQSTSISGLTAGVRYRISLHAVTSRVVSAPSSRLAYSREKTPFSGPDISVLAHENGQILIQWNELPVHQQRGHITKYTIYIQRMDSTHTVLNVTVSESGPTRMWLDCPTGALFLHMTAWTSAGEGPPGKPISSQPADYTVDLVIVVIVIIAVLIAITANLMCWRCIREWVKQKCISWGPEWFVEHMPNIGRSNAIRLLKPGESEPLFPSSYSETPLSHITVVSPEASKDVYPTIHTEVTPIKSGPVDTLVGSEEGHCDYKPQTATFTHQGKELDDKEDNLSDNPAYGEENGCACISDGLIDGLRFNGDVDFSDSLHGLALFTGLIWPTTAETTVLTEQVVGADSLSLDLKQEEIEAPDTTDTSWSQHTSEATLNGGYFPQVAAACSTTR